MEPDFRLVNHGSLYVLYANSDAAKQWVADNLPEDAPGWGPNGVVIEPRYVSGIVLGFQADGLTV